MNSGADIIHMYFIQYLQMDQYCYDRRAVL